MKQYVLTIGENNITHEVEVLKIKEYLNNKVEGYTISSFNEGIWKGNTERSINVQIISDIEETSIKSMVVELKQILEQDAILFESKEFLGEFI